MEFDLNSAAKPPPCHANKSDSLLGGESRHLIILRLFIFLFIYYYYYFCLMQVQAHLNEVRLFAGPCMCYTIFLLQVPSLYQVLALGKIFAHSPRKWEEGPA